ncbi:hypothetical protein F5B22DRAFT_533868 [Xylaria bambusicola]|uniref:uncharacterized protein n=1 Tax=Xylaria bambusicola TaxID=326684 RepID=UPI00200872DE|nr:uncharacterized protein F5B22DRAFT_533868 [Xylaria bambusicola]KAI0505220.1 hypothetical protein F5B22DRAFT_533868 [Xylaria bambusicola]
MAIQRSPARSGRGGGFLTSALRFAGYDFDCRSTTPTSQANSTKPGAGGVSAGGRYMHTLPPDVESARSLLEEYSGIPPEHVDTHVYQMRDRLWDVYPFACVGRFRFLSFEFTADAYYQVALFRLLQAQTEPEPAEHETRLLDVGCCVGQVLRKLAFDGVDSSRLYGTDVEPRFLDIGYELFRDRNTFQADFVIGDLVKQGEGDERLDVLDGKMTFIHATSFFHLFTWDDQVRAAIRMVRFLQPGRRDAMIFGRQVGTVLPRDNGKAGSDKVYLHNAHSWQRLWDEVGERTGTKWKTTMEPTETIETGAGGVESSLRKMTFSVVRG